MCYSLVQTINQSVQNNLNKLERDCAIVYAKIEELLIADTQARRRNQKATSHGMLAFCASLLAPVMLFGFLAHRTGLAAIVPPAIPPDIITAIGQTCDLLIAPDPLMRADPTVLLEEVAAAAGADVGNDTMSTDGAKAAPVAEGPVSSRGGLLTLPQFLFAVIGMFISLQLLSRLLWRHEPQLTKREVQQLTGTQRYVKDELLVLKVRLYKLYIDQCSSEVQ